MTKIELAFLSLIPMMLTFASPEIAQNCTQLGDTFKRLGMHLLKSILTAVTIIGLVAMSVAAKAAECITYQIQINVVAESALAPPAQATVNQLLVLRREGYRNNPYEIFFIFPGDPNAQVTLGNLEVLTNNRFARNPGHRRCSHRSGRY